jgi:hypothetical protein
LDLSLQKGIVNPTLKEDWKKSKNIKMFDLPVLVHQGETRKQLKELPKEMMFSPKLTPLQAKNKGSC